MIRLNNDSNAPERAVRFAVLTGESQLSLNSCHYAVNDPQQHHTGRLPSLCTFVKTCELGDKVSQRQDEEGHGLRQTYHRQQASRAKD